MSTAHHPQPPPPALTGRRNNRQLDTRPFFIERGSTVRVRQRAFSLLPAQALLPLSRPATIGAAASIGRPRLGRRRL